VIFQAGRYEIWNWKWIYYGCVSPTAKKGLVVVLWVSWRQCSIVIENKSGDERYEEYRPYVCVWVLEGGHDDLRTKIYVNLSWNDLPISHNTLFGSIKKVYTCSPCLVV
jgi:hypothetical protein